MNRPLEQYPDDSQQAIPAAQPRRWRRIARYAAIGTLLTLLCVIFVVKDHLRTLASLRRIPGTNAYVMDYYVDYNIGHIRSQGMDIDNIEDGLIRVFFPKAIVPFAAREKGRFIPPDVVTLAPGVHHCSTVVFRAGNGNVFFGRNFDWKHDACLIVKTHDGNGLASMAVIDLHYLNLDRDDLDATNLYERIPLLFAPYYLQDGMNRHGVAVADMSVDEVTAPHDAAKPNILHATAMRLVLDYATTTDDALELLEEYNIHFAEATCHLMIADSRGKSAVVEYIDGRMVASPIHDNWQVCTNHRIAGKKEEDNDERRDRYRLASDQLAVLPSVAGTAEVMRIMESVAQQDWTMWTSVYNLSTLELQLAYRQHFGDAYRDSLELAQ